MSALSYATAQLLRVLPRAQMSRAAGRLADFGWPEPIGRAVVGVYSRYYGVELEECQKKAGFTSFDDFFTRQLRDGVRPLDADPRAVLSPADGHLDSLGRVESGREFRIKGRPYRVEDLVGSREEAESFSDGAGFVVYLSPRDYHRLHAPLPGRVTQIRSMPGDYFPVNDVGVQYVRDLFAINRRVAISMVTGPELGHVRMTVVLVAAIIVGRISVPFIDARDVPLGVHRLDPAVHVGLGAEIGCFHLGSTAVVFMQRPPHFEPVFGRAGPIRYGERVLTWQPERSNGGPRARPGAE